MRLIHVKLRIRPDKVGVYERTFHELRTSVHQSEPGCTFFELCKDAKRPFVYHVFEAYADEAAIAAHCATDHYASTARVFVECLEGDHMEEINRRHLTGRDMYAVVRGIEFERFETL
jgi:quinol monooxygenase YgiN